MITLAEILKEQGKEKILENISANSVTKEKTSRIIKSSSLITEGNKKGRA